VKGPIPNVNGMGKVPLIAHSFEFANIRD